MGFSQPLGKKEERGKHYFDGVKNQASRIGQIRTPVTWLPRLRFFICRMRRIFTVIVTMTMHSSQWVVPST